MKLYEQSHKTPKFEFLYSTLTGIHRKRKNVKMSKIQSHKRQKPKTIYQQQTESRKPNTVSASEARPETWTRSAHRQTVRRYRKPESIPGRNESRKPPEICRPEPPESYPQSTRTAPANFSKNHPSIFPIFKNFQKFFGRSGDMKNIGGGIKKPCIIFSHMRKLFKKFFRIRNRHKTAGGTKFSCRHHRSCRPMQSQHTTLSPMQTDEGYKNSMQQLQKL